MDVLDLGPQAIAIAFTVAAFETATGVYAIAGLRQRREAGGTLGRLVWTAHAGALLATTPMLAVLAFHAAGAARVPDLRIAGLATFVAIAALVPSFQPP